MCCIGEGQKMLSGNGAPSDCWWILSIAFK